MGIPGHLLTVRHTRLPTPARERSPSRIGPRSLAAALVGRRAH